MVSSNQPSYLLDHPPPLTSNLYIWVVSSRVFLCYVHASVSSFLILQFTGKLFENCSCYTGKIVVRDPPSVSTNFFFIFSFFILRFFSRPGTEKETKTKKFVNYGKMSGIIDPPRHVNVPTGNFYAPSTAIKTSFIFNVAECSRRVPKKQWCLLNGSLKGTYTIHVQQFVEMKWPSYKLTHWTHFIELVRLFQLSRKISFFRSLFFVAQNIHITYVLFHITVKS